MTPEWMNWGGWRWVFLPIEIGIGIWFGYYIATINARSRAWRLDLKTGPAVALVELLARQKDPTTCPSIDDEVEAFADFIRRAKFTVGDLSEDNLGEDVMQGGAPNE